MRAKAVFLTSFVFLANVPDFPIRGWGHDRYLFSHSLFVNLAIIALIVIVLSLWKTTKEVIGGKRIIVGGIITWLSHLLLDSFYNHGKGIAIYWPFWNGRLAFPMPWFSPLQSIPPPFNSHTVKECLIEFLFYLPLALISIYWRQMTKRQERLTYQ
jgi:membrane-bound metal-dependent hydrolase YbcI (DUF457 family)